MQNLWRRNPNGTGFRFETRFIAAALLVLAVLSFSSCGVQTGLRSNSDAVSKASAGRVLILPLFENETFEPILERQLTQIFKETLFQQGWTVISRNQGHTKVLRGRITSFGLRPIALNPVGAAREYRIDIGLALVLLQEEGGAEDLKLRLQGMADFIARPDPGSDRVSKDRAIREAGRGMAEQLVVALEGVLDAKPKALGK